jgi:HSF-type DNA-binding
MAVVSWSTNHKSLSIKYYPGKWLGLLNGWCAPRCIFSDALSCRYRYFRQSKLTSFQRQLNLYGFNRLTHGRDRGGYYHEYFLRGRPCLSKHMFRVRIKGIKVKAANSPDQEPDFYALPKVASCACLTNSASASAYPRCESPKSATLQIQAQEDVSPNSDVISLLTGTTDCAIPLSTHELDLFALPAVASFVSATTSASDCDVLRSDSPLTVSLPIFTHKDVSRNNNNESTDAIWLSGQVPDFDAQPAAVSCALATYAAAAMEIPRCDSPLSTLSHVQTEEHASCGSTAQATFVDTNEFAIPLPVLSPESKLDRKVVENMFAGDDVTDQLSVDHHFQCESGNFGDHDEDNSTLAATLKNDWFVRFALDRLVDS